MQIRFKEGYLIASPETELEACDLAAWKAAHAGHVLLIQADHGEGLALRDLGTQAVACREPINVTSRHPEAAVRLISNFAETPFVLEGEWYASVEGFWQGLYFADTAERRRIAQLVGLCAKRASHGRGHTEFVVWRGENIRTGSPAHWQLMRQACWAKFTQHAEARAALLGTAPRPLVHRMRRDSVEIPGAIMAEIWTKIREQLGGGSS